ncbi:MAG TPA: hypothetical protein VIJ75_17710 [Hanamia sp.]
MENKTFCQSCSMPLEKPEFWGQKKMAPKATNIARIATKTALSLIQKWHCRK